MDEPRWLTDDEQRTWRSYLAMTELVRATIARDLMSASGMSEPEFTVLVHLSERSGREVRMSDLADGLGWSKSRLSHQVARMEARGLVERSGCPSDARGSFARLTAAGLAEIERAAPHHVHSVRRVLIDALDPDQLAALRTIADTVISRAREDGEHRFDALFRLLSDNCPTGDPARRP